MLRQYAVHDSPSYISKSFERDLAVNELATIEIYKAEGKVSGVIRIGSNGGQSALVKWTAHPHNRIAIHGIYATNSLGLLDAAELQALSEAMSKLSELLGGF